MSLIKIVSALEFIKRITGGNITHKQSNRAIAYLRAKGIVFYDNWDKEHVMLHDDLMKNKSIVIEALNSVLDYH